MFSVVVDADGEGPARFEADGLAVLGMAGLRTGKEHALDVGAEVPAGPDVGGRGLVLDDQMLGAEEFAVEVGGAGHVTPGLGLPAAQQLRGHPLGK
jgi:hypothetical protein